MHSSARGGWVEKYKSSGLSHKKGGPYNILNTRPLHAKKGEYKNERPDREMPSERRTVSSLGRAVPRFLTHCPLSRCTVAWSTSRSAAWACCSEPYGAQWPAASVDDEVAGSGHFTTMLLLPINRLLWLSTSYGDPILPARIHSRWPCTERAWRRDNKKETSKSPRLVTFLLLADCLIFHHHEHYHVESWVVVRGSEFGSQNSN